MDDKLNTNVVGERLAALRKLNALTLEEVAQRSTLTKSYLSKLERGLSSPTIATVLKLARALEISPDQLVGATTDTREILHQRPGDRVPFSPSKGRQGYTYEAIATDRADKAMTPFVMSPPFTLDGQELVSHPGEEFIFVISGELEVVFEDRAVRMAQGDTLYFNASLPHRSRSLGDTPAHALVVVSDPARRRAGEAGAG
ncbi:helix-turn-helix domain-containing protein [Bordetella sp. 2513F-2]